MRNQKQHVTLRLAAWVVIPFLIAATLFAIGLLGTDATNRADIWWQSFIALAIELLGAALVFWLAWYFFERTVEGGDVEAAQQSNALSETVQTVTDSDPLIWRESLIEALAILVDNGSLTANDLNIFRSPLGNDGVELLSRQDIVALQLRAKTN